MDLSSIAYPKLEDIQSALFIQPHPDDNEIGAGGTMAYLTHQGIPVYGLTVTEGRGGSKTIEPEELGKIRKIEAQNAMDVLGVVNLGCLGYHDNRPIIHETLVKELVRIIREVKPQAIFTVDPQLPDEMHPVHIQVGRAVQEAYMRCGQIYYPFEDHAKHADAFSPDIIGFYFTADDNTILDISDWMDLKCEAILKHKTQVDRQTLESFKAFYALVADGTDYQYAERLKLLSSVHTHCFAIPTAMKALLKK